MVEEIITGLSRIKWLFVIARNSADIELGRYSAGRALKFDRSVCASRFRKMGR
jgi:TolB-like protein